MLHDFSHSFTIVIEYDLRINVLKYLSLYQLCIATLPC